MSALLTRAKDERGNPVTIEEAIHEKGTNYFCEICGNPLIARNTIPPELAKREHHFAHKKGCTCEATDETLCHQWAKEIILEEQSLMLPDDEHGDRPSGLVHFRSVESEKWDSEYGIRPDIDAITTNGERVLIEFYVSHKVPYKKRRTIIKNNLNCIEIDLNYVEVDKEDIRFFLMQDAGNRKWISQLEKRNVAEGSFYIHSRNPWHEKAIDFLKKQFEQQTLEIGESQTFNLRQLNYDVCEPSKMYRSFNLDLMLYRSKKEERGYIAISVRSRRRNKEHETPRNLRVIDIIIRDENDYKRLIQRGNLTSENGFIIYEGFKFK